VTVGVTVGVAVGTGVDEDVVIGTSVIVGLGAGSDLAVGTVASVVTVAVSLMLSWALRSSNGVSSIDHDGYYGMTKQLGISCLGMQMQSPDFEGYEDQVRKNQFATETCSVLIVYILYTINWIESL